MPGKQNVSDSMEAVIRYLISVGGEPKSREDIEKILNLLKPDML